MNRGIVLHINLFFLKLSGSDWPNRKHLHELILSLVTVTCNISNFSTRQTCPRWFSCFCKMDMGRKKVVTVVVLFWGNYWVFNHSLMVNKEKKYLIKRNTAHHNSWQLCSPTFSQNISSISSVWHSIVIITISPHLLLPALEGLHMLSCWTLLTSLLSFPLLFLCSSAKWFDEINIVCFSLICC